MLAIVVLVILSSTALTGCTSGKENRQIVRTEYVRQQVQEPPAPPEYYPVTFTARDGLYCLDPDNAKGLLKNRELDRGYQAEMRSTLESPKEGGDR